MKAHLTYLVVGLTALLLMACSDKTSFQRSSIVPAAEAELRVQQDNNNNYRVEVAVENLAEPQNLDPPKDAYVVWLETEDDQLYNLGQLIVDKNLNGSLSTVTPHKPNRVFITAEENATASYPGNQVVLESRK